MNISEYLGCDALGLAELVRKKDVRPKELALLAAQCVEKVNPTLNAVIEVYADRVDGLDESAIPEGPFHGVPFFLKDLGPRQKGRPQDGGSRLTQGYVADYTSFIAAKMERSGLNVMGRTTCPEFGITGTTESILTGATCNPWDTTRIAGGSSGGSAAIVAAGVVPMAHSNDGGGSTRLPASICGNVGLKNSRGRTSYAPDGCDISFPLFAEGVNARSVRDAAAFLDATRGPAPGEAVSFVEPPRSFLEETRQEPGGLRIAVSTQPWGARTLDRELADAVQRTGGLCEELGHTVAEATPPIDFESYYKLFRDIWCIDLAVMLDMEAEHMGREVSPQTVEPITMKIYEEGLKASAADRLMVTFGMSEISRQLGAFFEDYDLILTGTMAGPTPLLGSGFNLLHEDQSLDDWFENALDLIPYTPLNNFTGTPAISLPLSTGPNNMPLGMHFMAPMGREDRLLRIAAQLEEAAPWRARLPDVHVSKL